MAGHLLKLALFLSLSAALLLGLYRAAIRPADPPLASAPQALGSQPQLGNPDKLLAAYTRWVERHERNGGDTNVVVSLGWSKALSTRFTRASGRATLDLERAAVRIEVEGLSSDETYEAWLVDNGREEDESLQAGEGLIYLGRLTEEGGAARLQTQLRLGELSRFRVDRVVVLPSGDDPRHGGLLLGTPSLFQRLYTSQRTGQAWVAQAAGDSDVTLVNTGTSSASLAALVAQGEALFFTKTFSGNGRTCGTCHPAENNYTIDPAYIATLPKRDPLFVAEFMPALSKNFENPVLMRQYGLIVENVDGFDDLESKFTMRSVPHILAMGTRLEPSEIDGSGGGLVPPFERTGWSGDGAAGGGTLREFALGAVKQHAPRTLARQPGSDFVFPTEAELDALEAFMLSLGRDADPDLSSVTFKDANVQAGLDLFNGAGKCAFCHFNGGANVSFMEPAGSQNANFDTGVEDAPHPADALGQTRPRDGGFGTEPNPKGGFGDGTFNTPPVIEAADTGPYFHNNLVATLEEAVEFYNSAEFNSSPSGIAAGGISLSSAEVKRVSALLRVLNALENIRSASSLIDRAKGLSPAADDRTLNICNCEIDDAIDVLSAVGLHSPAVARLRDAKRLVTNASRELRRNVRDSLLQQASDKLNSAGKEMVAGGG